MASPHPSSPQVLAAKLRALAAAPVPRGSNRRELALADWFRSLSPEDAVVLVARLEPAVPGRAEGDLRKVLTGAVSPAAAIRLLAALRDRVQARFRGTLDPGIARRLAGPAYRGIQPDPTLQSRCRLRRFERVPSTYAAFEAEVMAWIATCEKSRSDNSHREVALVRGNPSLMELYPQLPRDQPVTIVPSYLWGPDRIEFVGFSSPDALAVSSQAARAQAKAPSAAAPAKLPSAGAGSPAGAGVDVVLDPNAGWRARRAKELVDGCIDWLNDDWMNDGKVALSTFLVAARNRVLREFLLELSRRPHNKYGSYLALFFAVIHGKIGAKTAAGLVKNARLQGIDMVLNLDSGDRDGSLPNPGGAGVGALITYEGKTLFRLGDTEFFISGRSPAGGWIPPKDTSVLFIYRRDNPKKMYRLDYGLMAKGPAAGTVGWHHNSRRAVKVLGLKVTNHQPAGRLGRAAGRAALIYKWGGRAMFLLELAGHAEDIYYADDKKRAVVKAIASLSGAAVGALIGARFGATIGVRAGPIGAVIGAGAGGIIGAYVGSSVAEAAATYVYDVLFVRLEREEWVVLEPHEVEPA